MAARDQRHDRCRDIPLSASRGRRVGADAAQLGHHGYLRTVSWRTQRTAEDESNVVWLSPLVPLVDSEPTTELQRLAMVVDCANGAGAALDPEKFVFMNTDTAVHIHRLPLGNDFAVRSRGSIGPDGIGATTADVFDHQGFIGTVAQTLLVHRRP